MAFDILKFNVPNPFHTPLEQALLRAKITFGGTSFISWQDTFSTINLLFDTFDDYNTVIKEYPYPENLIEDYSDLLLDKIHLASARLSNFSKEDFEELKLNLLYKIDFALCAHYTTLSNYQQILRTDPINLILKKNRNLLGDLGDGVYMFILDSSTARQSIINLINETPEDTEEKILITYDYSHNSYPYTDTKLYLYEPKGYILSTEDFVIPTPSATIEHFKSNQDLIEYLLKDEF